MMRTPKEVLERFPAEVDKYNIPKAQAEIMIGCTEQIAKSIDELRNSLVTAANSNNKLSGRVFWLNIILAIATATGATAAMLSFIYRK